MPKLPISTGILASLLFTGLFLSAPARAADPARRNVIIFVADGLRHGAVDSGAMPTFADLRKNGVDFVNSHSLYPTVTTPNASAIATGHYLGDTGNFSNELYTGFLRGTDFTHAVENNINIADFDAHFEGNYLGETSLIAAARNAGFHTAIIGKHGPALVQDVTRNNKDSTADTVQTIFIDDVTGTAVSRNGERSGVPLPADFSRRLANDPYFKSTYFEDTVPNADPRSPATKVINVPQQKYFIDLLTRAILPGFVDPAGDKKPFAVVYWSRDPDHTQHNATDSVDKLVPGVNNASVRQAFANADNNLKQLLAYLRTTPDPAEPAKKLSETTDLFLTSDHGFSTVSRGALDTDPKGARVESFSTRQRYSDVAENLLPPGAIAIDLAHDLDLPLYDGDKADTANAPVTQYKKLKLEGTAGAGNWAEHPGTAMIGGTGTYAPDKGFDTSFIAIGGALYTPQITGEKADAATIALVNKAVAALTKLQYISGVFVDTQRFGPVPGALSFNDINLRGTARTPTPAIIVNCRTFSTDPANPYMTGVFLYPSSNKQGQGSHGTFGRQDTFNCMIAFGPDFKTEFSDTDPVSNADIAQTLAHITGINLNANARGKLKGRVITEALANGPAPKGIKILTKSSDPVGDVRTYLNYQEFTDDTGTYLYFDAAGFPGRTVGLTIK